MPQQEEKVTQILVNNKRKIIDFIGEFQNEREEEGFFELKHKMKEVLEGL